MPNWTRLTAPAAGAFSATWITRIGGLLFALILGGAFLINSCFSAVPTDPESLREPEGIAGDRATRQLGQRVQDLEQRAALDAAAAERQLAATGAQLTGGHVTPAFDPTTGETLPDGAAGPIAALTEDEAQLREVLRLEAIERRTRSLRSAPVAFSYRRPAGPVAVPDDTPAAPQAAPPRPATTTPARVLLFPPRARTFCNRLSPCKPLMLSSTVERSSTRNGRSRRGSNSSPRPRPRWGPRTARASRRAIR